MFFLPCCITPRVCAAPRLDGKPAFHLLKTWIRQASRVRYFTGEGRSTQDSPVPSDMAKIISIEGNIGVGKTTLAYKLGDLLNYSVFVEPTAKNPYLARFYADPKKYATKLQLWIFKQRYVIYQEALHHLVETGRGVVLDRSVFSDEVFARVSHDLGNISDDGFAVYSKLRKKLLTSLMPPHLYVYLDASPKICLERIKKRGRSYEQGITTDYLSLLEVKYQSFRNSNKAADISELPYDWSEIGSAELVARDITLLSMTGTSFENYKNLLYNNNTQRSLVSELDDQLSDNDEDCIDMCKAERDAFAKENGI